MKEETLIRASPAMFRNHPVWFLLLLSTLMGAVVRIVLIWSKGPEPIYLYYMQRDVTLALSMPLPFHVEIAAAYKNEFMIDLAGAATAVVVAFLWWISCRRTRLTVTSQRTILRRGLLALKTSEIPHSEVRETAFRYQGWLQKVFDVGQVVVRSVGRDGVDIRVAGLENPQHIVGIVDQHRSSSPVSQRAPVIYQGFGNAQDVDNG